VAAPSLQDLDYAVVQQCMHCGLCLPSCPTYELTKIERHSPRGRIALMRSIADGRLEVSETFGHEMYYCLGCLACESACPADVHYAELFETARAEIERKGVLANPRRDSLRRLFLKDVFTKPSRLRWIGRSLFLFQATGLQWFIRTFKLTMLLPRHLRELEKLSPRVQARFSDALIRKTETPRNVRYRVGVLTGCVQDLIYASVNRDTVDVLLANGCETTTPREQFCCGSLHAHNGEWETARELARRQIDAFDLEHLDAIITNAAGCGSHLKHYGRLLADDPAYAAKAKMWSTKVRDISEWLAAIGIRPPTGPSSAPITRVTYHEACHLCHGQKITEQPRAVLRAVPGVELIELPEATWCCGSAGVYNITQPETARKLQQRKLQHIASTGASVVATANPGCLLQIDSGQKEIGSDLRVVHPVTLLAEAYRAEKT
jgi:glycolate oxidase iron-sulfur subunit